MKKHAILLPVAIAFMLLTSCAKIDGEGDVVTEERTLPECSGISLAMDAYVTYTPDTAYSLTIQGQQNILDHIETTVKNGTLVIKFEDHVRIGSHKQITAVVKGPGISNLEISGSGNMTVDNAWDVYSADLNISGSGNLSMALLNAHDLDANISGSGNIKGYYGNCKVEHLTISGSGNIDMLGVEADSAWANISGSGDIKLAVSVYLNATISGSGNIRYYGNPLIVTNISGSGTVSYIQPLE